MGCGAERGGAKVMLQHAQRQSRLRLQCCHGAQHPPRASRARLRSAGVLQRSEPRSRCCTGASGSAARVSRKPWTACASEAAGPQQPRLPGAHNKQLTLLQQRSSGINWGVFVLGRRASGGGSRQAVRCRGRRARSRQDAGCASPMGAKVGGSGRAPCPGCSPRRLAPPCRVAAARQQRLRHAARSSSPRQALAKREVGAERPRAHAAAGAKAVNPGQRARAGVIHCCSLPSASAAGFLPSHFATTGVSATVGGKRTGDSALWAA